MDNIFAISRSRKFNCLNFLSIFLIGIIFSAGLVLAVTWVGDDVNYFGIEDTPYLHNFTANISDPAVNMSFAVDTVNTHLFWNEQEIQYSNISSWIYILDSSTGIFLINVSSDNQAGHFFIPIKVTWSSGSSAGTPFNFTINATNDAPVFNLSSNYTFGITSENISYNITLVGSDEEQQYPLVYNVSFIACEPAAWSSKLGTPNNCNLSYQIINSGNTTSILNITNLTSDDIGIYNLSICVHDDYTKVASPTYIDSSYETNKTTCKNTTILVEKALALSASDCSNSVLNESENFLCSINITSRGQNNNLIAWSNSTLRNTGEAASNSSWFFGVNNSNSEDFAMTYYVNLTPQKREIGNWSINFTVMDLTSGENLTIPFYVYVNRTIHSLPLIDFISNRTTSISLQNDIFFNVTDDDFLIPDKGVYNESIIFNWNILNTSDMSQTLNLTNFTIITSGTGLGVINNITRAKIRFIANASESGNYTVNLTATDISGFRNSTLFNLVILNNNAPVWSDSVITTFLVYEDNNTYINFSLNASDSDGGTLRFSYSLDNSFPSFSINSSTGIVNFTGNDSDVGQHIVSLIVSDALNLTDTIELNFTVYNINDNPYLDSLEESGVVNATVDLSSNVNATEENRTMIVLWIYDMDLLIPSNQKGFYNESFSINLTIEGVNSSLFNFSLQEDAWPNSNQTEYQAVFTPSKADVGFYNITINVTDASNSSVTMRFNLTITELEHVPTLMAVSNQTAALTRVFNYNFSAYDSEDGNSSHLGNYNFTFTLNDSLGKISFNSSQFNLSTGSLSILFNQSQAGIHLIYLNVTDSYGMKASTHFWIRIYDYPNITLPNIYGYYNSTENVYTNFSFAINHSVGDSLNYSFYFNFVLLNSSYRSCNGSNFTFVFTPNFTQETYGLYENLSLEVFNPIYPDLNYTGVYYFNITHSNFVISNYEFIPNISSSSTFNMTLKSYFRDYDSEDSRINQTVIFNYTLINLTSGDISISLIDWINGSTPSAFFSASSSSSGVYSITANEYNESNSSQIINNVVSNNFTVTLDVTSTSTPVPSSGGGGGGSTIREKILKLIVAPKVIVEKKGFIEIPFQITNTGYSILYGINLTTFLAEEIFSDAKVSLSMDFISQLASKETQNLSLYIDLDTEKEGQYLVTINASVLNPRLNDWASFYLGISSSDRGESNKMIIFTEKLIAENPECLELKELIDEAQRLDGAGEYEKSIQKSQEAIDACKKEISFNSQAKVVQNLYENYPYYFLFTGFVLLLFVIYFIYNRVRFKYQFPHYP